MRTLAWSSLLVLAASLLACGDSTGTGGTGGSGGSNTGGEPAGGSPSTGGDGTGGSGGAAPMTPCEEICAFDLLLEEDIMCGYDGSTCVVDCEDGFSTLPAGCDDEAIAYNDCLIAQPSESFNCTNMVFTLSTPECDDQLNALITCQ